MLVIIAVLHLRDCVKKILRQKCLFFLFSKAQTESVKWLSKTKYYILGGKSHFISGLKGKRYQNAVKEQNMSPLNTAGLTGASSC